MHAAHPGRVAVEIIALPGELFLRMLKMPILPLIIFSLMAGLGSLDTRVAVLSHHHHNSCFTGALTGNGDTTGREREGG